MPTDNSFKSRLGDAAISELSHAIEAVDSGFDAASFRSAATDGLGELELKARVLHIGGALRRFLPQETREAIALLARAGDSWLARCEEMPGFAAWPMIDFVGEYGEDLETSLDALRRLTPLFSAEFAIRPFIERDQTAALSILGSWLDDPSEHVRRLISEGTRPRLPWGRKLRGLVADPSPIFELLEALRDDRSEYVRRSVSNNLNDIAKDHPDRVVEIADRWLEQAPNTDTGKQRRWIIERGLRTLIKAGHPGALSALGFRSDVTVELSLLDVQPRAVELGENFAFSFSLQSNEQDDVEVVVDYAIHHVKKSGARVPKVFKLTKRKLRPGEAKRFEKQHALRPITTRTYYPGRHAIEILVNGLSYGMIEFDFLG